MFHMYHMQMIMVAKWRSGAEEKR